MNTDTTIFIIACFMMFISGYLTGARYELRRHLESLKSHTDFLRENNSFWRSAIKKLAGLDGDKP